MRQRAAWFSIAAIALVTRFAHLDIVWVEEGYPAAAAVQMLHGKLPYRDFWFDKPPLAPALYLLWGAWTGWPLRVAGAVFVLLAAWVVWRFARDLWGEREGLFAAALMTFFLTFGIPSAVMALAPDLVLLVPHAAAVWMASRGRPFAAGLLAGIALLCHTKGIFVFAACLIWCWRKTPIVLAGFVLPNLILLPVARPYFEQVWQWGFLYAGDTFVENPLREGLLRTLNWAGFQAALVAGAAMFWWRERSRPFALWAVLSFLGAMAGLRFFPRYYFQLLPVMTLAAARAMANASRPALLAMALLLAIPFARFAPRYATLIADRASGREHQWADLAMADDSRRAAAAIQGTARPGDTLLVWGYRPDIFALTRMPAGAPYLDSQPLTGVIADRHLRDATPAAPALAAEHRRKLTATQPVFIVDGLGPYNPRLAIASYDDLRAWLGNYSVVVRTAFSVIYKRTT